MYHNYHDKQHSLQSFGGSFFTWAPPQVAMVFFGETAAGIHLSISPVAAAAKSLSGSRSSSMKAFSPTQAWNGDAILAPRSMDWIASPGFQPSLQPSLRDVLAAHPHAKKYLCDIVMLLKKRHIFKGIQPSNDPPTHNQLRPSPYCCWLYQVISDISSVFLLVDAYEPSSTNINQINPPYGAPFSLPPVPFQASSQAMIPRASPSEDPGPRANKGQRLQMIG